MLIYTSDESEISVQLVTNIYPGGQKRGTEPGASTASLKDLEALKSDTEKLVHVFITSKFITIRRL